MNREFLVRIKRGNEAEAQVPIWIPLSIIAKGAAISHGTSAHVAQSAVDAIIGYGGVVANRSRGGQYVDAMGEVSMASKVSALALTKAGGSDEAALAVQRAVLGWGGYLVAYIYANNVVVLDDSSSSITDERYGHHQKRNRREGGSDARHNPLWKASLAAFRSSSTATSKADSRDYSTMTIPSSCSRAIHERKSIVDYYETNVGKIPLIGSDIYIIPENQVKLGERQLIPLNARGIPSFSSAEGISSVRMKEECKSSNGDVPLSLHSSDKNLNRVDEVLHNLQIEQQCRIGNKSMAENKESSVDIQMIQSNNKQIHPTIMSKLSTKKNMIGLLILALIAIIAVTLGVGLKSLSEESKVSTFNSDLGDSNTSVSNELEVISEWEWEHEKSLPGESKVNISNSDVGDYNISVADELEVILEWEMDNETSLSEESKVTTSTSGDYNISVADELEVVSEWEWEYEMTEEPCVGEEEEDVIIEPIRALRAKKSSNDRSSVFDPSSSYGIYI